jgi:tetratricopeptide (TPR) repeat protein
MTHRRRYAEAERLYREVLAIARRALAPGHLNTLLIQVNLADVLRLQKRFGEAEPLFQSTLRDMEALVGPDHPERAAALEMYAALLRDTGRRKVAKVTLAEAKEIRQRHARIDGSALVVDARSL